MGGRGRRHEPELRKALIELVDEAVNAGARQQKACDVIGVSERTLQRWRTEPDGTDGRQGPKTAPAHRLTEAEKGRIVKIANLPEYRNLTPEQIIADLAAKGEFVCSERSLRRILKARDLAAYRSRVKAPKKSTRPRQYVADGPLRVLSWDITYLRNMTVRGGFFYLYLFIDVWSRKVVGHEVHDKQDMDLSSALLRRMCQQNGIEPGRCVLHADNGAPMRGSTMLATMDSLGITRSFSRPSVSDDNAYVESFFRHLKYVPSYPSKGFASLEEARAWVDSFVAWYNTRHLHSGIGYVTPQERHTGADIEILETRRRVYEEARRRNPRRWTTKPRAWEWMATVTFNPERTVEVKAACFRAGKRE